MTANFRPFLTCMPQFFKFTSYVLINTVENYVATSISWSTEANICYPDCHTYRSPHLHKKLKNKWSTVPINFLLFYWVLKLLNYYSFTFSWSEYRCYFYREKYFIENTRFALSLSVFQDKVTSNQNINNTIVT